VKEWTSLDDEQRTFTERVLQGEFDDLPQDAPPGTLRFQGFMGGMQHEVPVQANEGQEGDAESTTKRWRRRCRRRGKRRGKARARGRGGGRRRRMSYRRVVFAVCTVNGIQFCCEEEIVFPW